MTKPVAWRAIVTGKVQGVGFRWAVRSEALRCRVGGWVRNLPDGSVEVFAQGPGEAMARLKTFLGKGPPGSRVDRVEVEDRLPERFGEDFRIRF